MSAPIEAQSISSLGHLLANPPRYPRNPTHKVHDPLVLYIVRVPGSRDVFLTTLKPPTKASISIEAVQSSLYYLHVERPEDIALREDLEAVKAATTRGNGGSPIQRKPLPSTPFANYPASKRPPTPPKAYPHYQPPLPGFETATQAERHAARGANLRLNTRDASQPFLASRKPNGARPMPSGPSLSIPILSAADDSSASPSPIDQAQKPFKVNRKPVQSVFPAHSGDLEEGHTDPNSHTRSSLNPPSESSRPISETSAGFETRLGGLCITLIRRDPASGSQWNVGSIVLQDAAGNPHEVDIELTSPGYTNFAKLDMPGQSRFRRQVAFLQNPAVGGLSMTRRRSNSAESFSKSLNPNNRKSRQPYGFVSPWQGICAFSNGIDGKSLRCRQALPGANASVPEVIADVAELRFNLPWAALRLKESSHKRHGTELSEVSPNKPVPSPDVPSNREQWRRSFQVLTHKAKKQLSSSESNNRWKSPENPPIQANRLSEESHFSLDLGREKAGGGFKGHSAKLGKLIIHDEGLKMCDLVVGACMGVWWQHYADNG